MGHRIRIVTYNIDGLPEKLDLSSLPWVFKPFVWIYKLFKGTTSIVVNDGQNREECTEYIGAGLHLTGSDIIGVQEDFNYHDILCKPLSDYHKGLYQGGFDLSMIFSKAEWFSHFPFPRFNIDGINIFCRKDRVAIMEEDIVQWKDSYGYFSHASDALTHKGFRRYTVCIDNIMTVDVYIMHMDADFYDPEKCPDISKDIEARKSQLKQLVEYIADRHVHHFPVIIMGDTNTSSKFQWDIDNINYNLLNPVNSIEGLTISEAVEWNDSDVDRMFYINDSCCPFQLKLLECYFGSNHIDGLQLSDHKPLFAEFDILDNLWT